MSRVLSGHARRVASTPAVAGFRPAVLAAAAAFAIQAGAQAQSVPLNVIHGGATFQRNGANLLVTTTNGAGSRSVIRWDTFGVPVDSTTRFLQPDALSTSVNLVRGGLRSDILGTLSSNGRLVLVNPAGIAVGAGAIIDTAGFTASTLDLDEDDAIQGRRLYRGGTGKLTVGEGAKILAKGGDVVLVGSQVQVERNAVVQASGATILAAGEKVELTGRGLEGIVMEVKAGNEAVNLGTLKGDAVGIFAQTLKHSGVAQAQAVTAEGGKVVLKAVGGDALVDGQAIASAQGGKGGSIDLLGQRVGLLAGATVDASGANGGGAIRIGGDYQGQNAVVPNAQAVYVDGAATVSADAAAQGDGGRVIVWSDGVTRMRGNISARGGATGGDGGFVEVSGKRELEFTGFADLRAAGGKVGTLLLDPQDITIFHTGDPLYANNYIAIGTATPGYTDFTYQGGTTYIEDAKVNLQLASSNLTILTKHDSTRYPAPISPDSGSGGQITMNADADINWTTANRLELLADKGIDIHGRITGDNAAASLKMTALNGGIVIDPSTATVQTGGSITLNATGDIQFGSLRTGYVSTGSGTGRSAGAVNLTAGGNVSGGWIDAHGDYRAGGNGGNGGDVTVTAGGAISLSSITAQGGDAFELPVFTMPPVPPGNGGKGGQVTLKANGGGVTVDGDISAYAGQSAGGSSAPAAAAGAAGGVEIAAKGDVALGSVYAYGARGKAGSAGGTVQVTADGNFSFDRIEADGGSSYENLTAGRGGNVIVDVKGDIVMAPFAFGDAINADGGYGDFGPGGQGGSISLKAGGTVKAFPIVACDCSAPPTTSGFAYVSASGGQGGSSSTGGMNGGAGGTIRVETGAPLVVDGSMIFAAAGGDGGDVFSGGSGVAGAGGAGGTVTLQSAGNVVLRDAIVLAGGGFGGVYGDGTTLAANGGLGTFTAAGTAVEVENSFLLDGHWSNNSVVNLRGAAAVFGTGSFRNASDVNLFDTGYLGMASVENGGRLRAFGSQVGATLTKNTGLVEVNAGSTLDAPVFFDNAGQLVVNGTLNIGSSATMTPPSPTPPPLALLAAAVGPGAVFTNQASGLIAGSGTINVDGAAGTVDNFGTLSPGGAGAVGTLAINGNLVMQSGSVLAADLLNTSSHDVVAVSGTVQSGGMVQVNVVPGAAFAEGATFPVLRSGALNASAMPGVSDPNFQAQSSGNDVLLVAQAGNLLPPVIVNATQQSNNQVTSFLTLFDELQQEEPRRIGKDDIVVTDTACTR